MIPKFRNSLTFETDEHRAHFTPNELLIQIASHNDKEKLTIYLSENKEINLLEIIDTRHYTLCHISCINNNQEMLEILVNYIHENFSKLNHKIPEWVNRKNLEGYTPLHMAAFKGNIKMIKYLEKIGADRLARNKHGDFLKKLIN